MSGPMDALLLDTSPEAQRRFDASLHREPYYHRYNCWVWFASPHTALLRWGHRRLRARRRKGEP